MTAHLKDLVAQDPQTARFSNDKDIKLFTDSLQTVFKNEAQSGNREFIRSLFNGEDKNGEHPLVMQLCSKVTDSLVLNGMQANDAQLLSSTTLPRVFNMYNQQIAEAKSKGIDIPQLMDDVLSGKFNYSDMGKLMSLASIFMKGKNSFLGKFF